MTKNAHRNHKSESQQEKEYMYQQKLENQRKVEIFKTSCYIPWRSTTKEICWYHAVLNFYPH